MCDQSVKLCAVVHVHAVRDFMRNRRLTDVNRRQYKSPAITDVARRRTATPPSLGVANTDRTHANAMA